MHVIRENQAYAIFIFVGLRPLQGVSVPALGEVTAFVGRVIFGTY